jgi:hypothetical protein
MEKSESSKDVDRLYIQICKMLKKYGSSPVPSKENFMRTVSTFNHLVEGHKSLLTAIGKL